MAGKNSDSGQVVLTSAILIAIVIVIVALMLNNIIYSTNVAYIGFMDGSKYEDQSIRQMTTKEFVHTYYSYPDDLDASQIKLRSQYMDTDYKSALNYLLNSKGKYVEFKPLSTAPSAWTSNPFYAANANKVTIWNLAITDKGSQADYVLAAPPAPVPSVPTVSLDAGTYQVTEDGSVTLTVSLSNRYYDQVDVDVVTSGTITLANYVPQTTHLEFLPGELTKTVTVLTSTNSHYDTPTTQSISVNLDNAHLVDGANTPINYGTYQTATINVKELSDPPAGNAPGIVAFPHFTATRDSSSKVVTITADVKNTAGYDLHHVHLTLVSPTGHAFNPGGLTVTVVDLGDLPVASPQSSTYTWRVQTHDNGNDKLTVEVLATADEFPTGITSGQKTNV